MTKRFLQKKSVIFANAGLCFKGSTWCRLSHVLRRYFNKSVVLQTVEKGDNLADFSDDDFEGEKTLAFTPDAHIKTLNQEPDSPADARSLRLAVIGSPNAGKSTLINRLMGWKVVPVSKKVHTTRQNANCVLTEDNKQIVFVDTPGMMSPSDMKKHFTSRAMVYGPELAMQQADLIAVIVDAADKFTRHRLDDKILKVLHVHKTIPSILILNKVDAMKSKYNLIETTRLLTEGVVGGSKINSVSIKLKRDKPNFNYSSYIKTLKNKIDEEGDKVDIEEYLQKKKEYREGAENSMYDTRYKTQVISLQEVQSKERENKIKSEELTQTVEQSNKEVKKKVGEAVTIKDIDRKHYLDYLEKVRVVGKEIRDLSGWPYFQHVFMISALENDGVDELKEYLLNQTKGGSWLFHSNVITDQNPLHLARAIVWEKLLEYLPKGLPYQIDPEIVLWEIDEDDGLNIIMDLVVERIADLRLVLGSDGSNIKQIADESRQELLNAFRCELRFKLQAKLKKTTRR